MSRIALAGAVLGALALVLVPLSVTHGARQYPVMDCTSLPPEAVTQLPPPIAQWTRLDCRPFGQVLAQQAGWSWRYSGTFMQEVMIAAIMGPVAEEGVGPRFFRDVSVATRDGQDVVELDRQLKQEVPSYAFIAGDETPHSAYTLRAVNDVLDIITVHFLEHAEGDLWAVACTPDCRAENVFLVRKVGG
jgi:hypothetical protein